MAGIGGAGLVFTSRVELRFSERCQDVKSRGYYLVRWTLDLWPTRSSLLHQFAFNRSMARDIQLVIMNWCIHAKGEQIIEA